MEGERVQLRFTILLYPCIIIFQKMCALSIEIHTQLNILVTCHLKRKNILEKPYLFTVLY